MLRDESEGLPPDLSWDNIKGGIFGAMSQQPNQAAVEEEDTAKRRLVWWWFLLLGGILAVGGYAYIGHQGDGGDGLAQPAPLAEQPRIDAAFDGQPAEASLDLPVPYTDPPLRPSAAGSTPLPVNELGGTQPSAFELPPLAPHASLQQASLLMDSLSATAQPLPQLAAQAGANTAEGLAPPLLQDRSTSPSPKPLSSFPRLATLAPALLPTSADMPLERANTVARKRARWHIGAQAGTLRELGQQVLAPNPESGATAQASALYSPFAHLYAEGTFFKNGYAQLGLAWQQINSRLDYQAVQPSQVNATNLVLMRQINAVTGDTLLLRGDTLLNATNTRTVRQYNQSTLINIPLALGYRRALGQWAVGLEAGASINISARHSGLHYNSDDGSLTPLSSTDGSLLKPRLGVALSAGLSVEYRISQQLSLELRSNLSRYTANWGAAPGISRQPALASHGIGFRWRL